MITFMVRHGFTLTDVRQLYIDEFYAYYEQLLLVLEHEGVIKKGTVERAKMQREGLSEVDMLRKQLRGLKPF